MSQAERLKAGAPTISANNMNKVIEQSNRLDAFQGGSGINSQNDATGFQLRNNRKRETPDGDSSYSSSSPWRRTMKRRTDATRHRGELELYNSSTVSARAVAPSSSRPQRYGIAVLPTSSDGSGDLFWPTMDADEFGSSGPRSLELRNSSSGNRFQLNRFDSSASVLDSSEGVQVGVRRRFGSSGNHYLDWIDSSTLPILGFPKWNQVLDATEDVTALPDTSGTRVFNFGSLANQWKSASFFTTQGWATAVDTSTTGYGGGLTILSNTVSGILPAVFLYAYGKMTLDSSELITLDCQKVVLQNIPRQASAPVGPSRSLWIDSADNTLKVVV